MPYFQTWTNNTITRPTVKYEFTTVALPLLTSWCLMYFSPLPVGDDPPDNVGISWGLCGAQMRTVCVTVLALHFRQMGSQSWKLVFFFFFFLSLTIFTCFLRLSQHVWNIKIKSAAPFSFLHFYFSILLIVSWESRKIVEFKLSLNSNSKSRWWFGTFFIFLLGISSSQLTHIFQRGWNHQPDTVIIENGYL